MRGWQLILPKAGWYFWNAGSHRPHTGENRHMSVTPHDSWLAWKRNQHPLLFGVSARVLTKHETVFCSCSWHLPSCCLRFIIDIKPLDHSKWKWIGRPNICLISESGVWFRPCCHTDDPLTFWKVYSFSGHQMLTLCQISSPRHHYTSQINVVNSSVCIMMQKCRHTQADAASLIN